MKILFVGDIMGRPGREAAGHFIPRLRGQRGVDVVIANAENAAGGKGLTPPVAHELFQYGVDVITLGNHTWAKKEVEPLLSDDRVLRPANYPPLLPGRGCGVYEFGGVRVAVLQLMGRHNMAAIDCPFRAADALLQEVKADVVVTDMHAEATSEKQAMGWYLDGRVAAVIGTHVHVQTADERLLPRGTAFITDVGMTGPRDGVIGADKDAALRRFLTGLPLRFDVAEGDAVFCAAVVDIDAKTGRALGIERLREPFPRQTTEKK